MPTITHSLPIQTTLERLWTLVSDVSAFAALFPFTTVEDIQTPEPNRWLFWRRLTIPNVAELHWREQAQVTGEMTLSFRAIEGDLNTFDGHWQVQPEGDHALLSLTLAYEIPAGKIKLPAMLATYAMGEVVRSICLRVKQVAEENAG